MCYTHNFTFNFKAYTHPPRPIQGTPQETMLTIVEEHLDCFLCLAITNKCYCEGSSVCLWLTYGHICGESVSRMGLSDNRICICSALTDIGNQLSSLVILIYTLTSNVWYESFSCSISSSTLGMVSLTHFSQHLCTGVLL